MKIAAARQRLLLRSRCRARAVRRAAADYPTTPIKIVVPYAPGGGADPVARIVARKVSEQHRLPRS